jgi:hypothetical protein
MDFWNTTMWDDTSANAISHEVILTHPNVRQGSTKSRDMQRHPWISPNRVARSYSYVVGVWVDVDFEMASGPGVAFDAAVVPVRYAGRE